MADDLTLPQFIENPLLHELRNMTHGESAARYLSFGQIAAGIEFLGACLDSDDWHDYEKSQTRFRLAMKYLMPKVDKRYGGLNDGHDRPYDLYSMLRGGMAHVCRPKGDFSFIGAGTAKDKGLRHLEVNGKSGKMVLVAEEFFENFEAACKDVLQQLPTLEKSSKKMGAKLGGIFLPVSY